MMRIDRARVALAVGAGVLVLALGACDQRPTGATGPAPTLRVAMRAAVMGNTSDALARVENAHVKVTLNGATVTDTTLAYTPGGIELAVSLPEPSGTVAVAVELLYHGQVLFRGAGSAEVQRGTETRVPITITPVVVGVVGPDSLVFSALGDSARLRGAAVLASGDTVLEAPLTWSADGGGVIAVTGDGGVTALKDGVGQAKVTYLTFTHATNVRVQASAARLTISATAVSLFVDSTATLSAAARDRNGNPVSRPVSWSSSSPGVATVGADGVVKGIAPGVSTVTASLDAQTASATVTVKRVPVAAVKVAPASATLVAGGTVSLTATTLDAKGAVLTGRTVTWTSSNPGVATVDGNGVVRGAAAGSASVTATCEGQSASAAIDVLQPLVAASPTAVGFSLSSGGSSQVGAVSVTNAGSGTLSGLGAGVTWVSGAPGWLSVALSSTTAPATLTLTASPGTLPVGTYTATVTVSSTIPGSGSVQVAVDMVVTPPSSGAIIGVEEGTDLYIPMRMDTLGAWTGITVNVVNLGVGTLSGLSSSVDLGTGPAGWLTASLASGTAPATLNIRAHGVLSPSFSYTGEVILSSSLPGVAPLHVHVTYGPQPPG